MKSLLKIILCFEFLRSSLAIFDNPFHLQDLFVRVLEIDSKIRQFGILEHEFIKRFQEKVFTFRQEIEKSTISNKDCNKHRKEKVILKRLCSNPIHVFQLILASHLIVHNILPDLDSRKKMFLFEFFSFLIHECDHL